MGKYVQLTRPRIVLMVLFALAVAAWTSGRHPPAWRQIVHALAGMALITAGSVALNQWYEQRSDALMARTQGRPIPSGRVPSATALAFGLLLSICGLAYLVLLSPPWVAILAAASWGFYVTCYTPLKSVSVWQLPVGAVAGAMPMLIGGAVAGAPLGTMALVLFGLVFFWQFPHAVAIAWIYRRQYARAGLRVVSVHDPTGTLSGRLALFGATALLPVSLLPVLFGLRGLAFAVGSLIFGTIYLVIAFRFWWDRDDIPARRMLWASFLYLPAILILLLFTNAR
jgi:protoheme IX farnesyltransferase